jgi:V/A-type H+-transporting ATPase subunit F
MKFHCIADEDTVRGFRLAGIEGEVVSSAAEAEQAVRRAAENPAIGILILTDLVAAEIRGLVDEIRVERSRPLIAEIPGPDGPMPGRKTLQQLVQEAVGIRIGQEEKT